MPPTDLFWRTFRPAEGFYNSEILTPDPQPVRTFLPTGYEPNYAYPLVVFFHGHGGSEVQILKLAPRLSRRNYICIGLRGPQTLDVHRNGRLRFGWGDNNQFDSQIEDYVLSAVEQTRRDYHVHSERIYLAGICEGASLAYRLGMLFPERFAGVIALNGAMPHGGPLFRMPQLRQLRVFIGHGLANAYAPLSTAKSDHRLLYTAGLDVQLKTYLTNHRLHPDMMRDLDQWIMKGINTEYQR
jgi:phospholipase/carboxylesterase